MTYLKAIHTDVGGWTNVGIRLSFLFILNYSILLPVNLHLMSVMIPDEYTSVQSDKKFLGTTI